MSFAVSQTMFLKEIFEALVNRSILFPVNLGDYLHLSWPNNFNRLVPRPNIAKKMGYLFVHQSLKVNKIVVIRNKHRLGIDK